MDYARLIGCALQKIQNRMRAQAGSANTADVADRADRGLEPLAQIGEQTLVGDETAVVVRHGVGEQRLEPRRRRHVVARRKCSDPALLLGRQHPGQIQLGDIGMRRILEDAGGGVKHRNGIDVGESIILPRNSGLRKSSADFGAVSGLSCWVL